MRNMKSTVADLHSKILDSAPPPGDPNDFQFHAVFGKIWQNRMLAPPPGELAPPPRGNPRSATDLLRPPLAAVLNHDFFSIARSDRVGFMMKNILM